MLRGQLWGGPGHGEPVSASVGHFRCEANRALFLDGGSKPPSVTNISGCYHWNPEKERFDWEGPGADGDTIERLRLQ